MTWSKVFTDYFARNSKKTSLTIPSCWIESRKELLMICKQVEQSLREDVERKDDPARSEFRLRTFLNYSATPYHVAIADASCIYHRYVAIKTAEIKKNRAVAGIKTDKLPVVAVDELVTEMSKAFVATLKEPDQECNSLCSECSPLYLSMLVLDKGAPSQKLATLQKRMTVKAKQGIEKYTGLQFDTRPFEQGGHCEAFFHVRNNADLECFNPSSQSVDSSDSGVRIDGSENVMDGKHSAFSLWIQPDRLIVTKSANPSFFDCVVKRIQSRTLDPKPHQSLLIDYRSAVDGGINEDVTNRVVQFKETGIETRPDLCTSDPKLEEEGEWGVIRQMRTVYPHNVFVSSVDGDFFPMFAYYIKRIREEFPNDYDTTDVRDKDAHCTIKQQIYWFRDNAHPILHVNALFYPGRAMSGVVWTPPMIALLSLAENDYIPKEMVLPGIGENFVLSAVHMAGDPFCSAVADSPPDNHGNCLSAFLALCFILKYANYRIPGDWDTEQAELAAEAKANQAETGEVDRTAKFGSKKRLVGSSRAAIKKNMFAPKPAPKCNTKLVARAKKIVDQARNVKSARFNQQQLRALIGGEIREALVNLARDVLTADRFDVLTEVLSKASETGAIFSWMIEMWKGNNDKETRAKQFGKPGVLAREVDNNAEIAKHIGDRYLLEDEPKPTAEDKTHVDDDEVQDAMFAEFAEDAAKEIINTKKVE